MELIDNVNKTLKDDLAIEIKNGSKISIASACFSIYAFQKLKAELKDIEELRFIFTSPTFTTDKTAKEKREFYIPRLNRERSICGTEFEVKLRNELTQKAIARECADWIRSKVIFKSNVTNFNNSFKIFQRMFCPTKQLDSKKVRYGICCIIFKEMLPLRLSINLKNIMVVS